MKTFISVALVLAMCLYVSRMNIQAKPFKVSFGDLPAGLGVLFIVLAVICFQLSGYKRGVKDGYSEAVDDVIELSKEKKQPAE